MCFKNFQLLYENEKYGPITTFSYNRAGEKAIKYISYSLDQYLNENFLKTKFNTEMLDLLGSFSNG